MRSPRRGFGRLATYLLLYAMCRFAFFCIKSTFNLIAQEHIRVRCNEMEQSDISLQRYAVCDIHWLYNIARSALQPVNMGGSLRSET